MTETGIKEAGILADRIRRAIETTKYEKGCMITISGGIMEFHNETAEELITGADRINYEAKNNGKNRIFGLQNEIKLKNM
jgi:PleD family two-component response regulator